MGRSEIHPSLCPYHAEREEQLFGVPSPGGTVVGRAFDLPELYSACRDLTTAAGVNRALAQVFRLLAQRRISRQEAATFGYLAQLLLQTVHPMRMDVPSSGESHQQGELSPVNSSLRAKVMAIRSFRASTKSSWTEGSLRALFRRRKPLLPPRRNARTMPPEVS